MSDTAHKGVLPLLRHDLEGRAGGRYQIATSTL